MHLTYDYLPVRTSFQDARYRVFENDERFATGHDKPEDEGGLFSRRIFDCDSGHGYDCYDSTPIPRAVLDEALAPGLRCAVLHPQPCSETVCDRFRASYRVNVVRACAECATDICFNVQDVEAIGRVIGLTTWKKLGGVYEGQPSASLAHCRNTRVPYQNSEKLRDEAVVYKTFENVRPLAVGKASPVCSHTPYLGRRVTSLFTQAPKIPDEEWSSCIPEWD